MTKSSKVKESVINGFLNGKSFAEIANENTIAKGSVHNIIREWINHIGVPDIDELRGFSVIVRKSGINIKQCAQGFRFFQILANFGISDEIDSTYTTEDVRARDNFYYFIDHIYNNCKNMGIKPADIVGWMQDLIDYSSLLFDNDDNNASRFERDINELDKFENQNTNKKFLYRKSSADTRNDNEKKVQIPLISKISDYIQYKKLEFQHLDSNNRKLLQEKRELEGQKDIILSKIIHLKEKESSALTYLDWYNSLKKDLLDIYDIKLEDEFNNFAKVIADFKYYGYDAHQIVKEYKQVESLRKEMASIQGIVNSIFQNRDNLLNEIASLKERESYSKQSLNALQDLRYAGFGLKELKQLKNTITEIAAANKIEYHDAGIKFLKDIETQYDYKLGFEPKIIELKVQLKKLEDEEPRYREYLHSNDIVNRALPFLYRFGVTDEDIINMSALVTAYFNGNIIFNPDPQPENMIEKNKLIKKTDYWKLFISEIKNLGDINSQTVNRRSYLEVIKKEVDRFYSQRQKLNEETLKSGQLLNSLNSQLSSFIEVIRQFIMFSVNNTNKKTFIVYQPLFFVNVTVVRDSKDDESDINPSDKSP